MTDDAAAILDDILIRWYQFAAVARITRGWNTRALVVGDYQTSRQYDDQNGALDESIERTILRSVDFQIGEMVDPYRAAIHVNARALVVGCLVFNSPRLPQDPDERRAVVATARAILTKRLSDAGVI